MPIKTSKKNLSALPTIPKKLIDQIVDGPLRIDVPPDRCYSKLHFILESADRENDLDS